MNVPAVASIDPSLLSALPGAGLDRAAKPTPEQVAKAAQQFEAILVRQLIAPAIEPMMSGGGMGGTKDSGGGVYGYMLTDSLATSIAAGGGLGLAKLFQSQLGAKAAPESAPLSL